MHTHLYTWCKLYVSEVILIVLHFSTEDWVWFVAQFIGHSDNKATVMTLISILEWVFLSQAFLPLGKLTHISCTTISHKRAREWDRTTYCKTKAKHTFHYSRSLITGEQSPISVTFPGIWGHSVSFTWHSLLFRHHHLVFQLLPLGYAPHALPFSKISFPLQWWHCLSENHWHKYWFWHFIVTVIVSKTVIKDWGVNHPNIQKCLLISEKKTQNAYMAAVIVTIQPLSHF